MSLQLYELRDGRFLALLVGANAPHIIRPTGKHTYECDCCEGAGCPCVGAVQEHVQAHTLAQLARAQAERGTAA